MTVCNVHGSSNKKVGTRFFYYFCMMIEGSGSGSIPLTSGSGSGKPKNMSIQWISIADPDPNPNPDPLDRHVFGLPGSGSTSQRYGSGSGSFYHHAKIVKKPCSYFFVTLFDFLSLKNDVNLASKSNKQKKLY
jgi:hypothetical protein